MIKIVGTGKCLPNTVLSNADLEKFVDTTDSWIVERTGIRTRRVITSESLSDMAVESSQAAIKNAGLSAHDIDMVVCSTIGGDYITPSLSCLVAGDLGLTVPSFDINAACSGLVYALDIVAAYIVSAKAKTVLLVGADAMSRHVDFSDRNTCVLFGDGASAMVITAGEQLKSIRLTSRGNSEFMCIPGPSGNAPFIKQSNMKPGLSMKGQEVYRFAVKALVEEVQTVMHMAGFEMSQLNWLVPHQANLRIIESAAKVLNMPMDKVMSNIECCGNTVSACIPSMLHDAYADNKLCKGDIIALCAFGGGLTTGAAVLQI